MIKLLAHRKQEKLLDLLSTVSQQVLGIFCKIFWSETFMKRQQKNGNAASFFALSYHATLTQTQTRGTVTLNV